MITNRPEGLFISDLPTANWINYVKNLEAEVQRLQAEKGAPAPSYGFPIGGAEDDQDGYEPDDPKSSSFRERMSNLWDMRPGK